MNNYYLIVLVSEVTLNMLKEAYTDLYKSKNYKCGKFDQYISNLRVITDTDVTPGADYFIIKLVNRFPLTMGGYKKYTHSEIITELAAVNWLHNQG